MVKIHIEPTPPKRLEQNGQLIISIKLSIGYTISNKHIADV